MTSILGAAASGMEYHAARIDVVANNLANVNTDAFKASRALAQGAPDPSAEPGRHGVAQMIVDRGAAPGSLRPSFDPIHVAIQDDSFFRVLDLGGATAYTRQGAFSVDAAGSLVVPGGLQLDPPVAIPEGFAAVSIDGSGIVTAAGPDGVRTEVGRIPVIRFTNARGLEALGNGLYRQTVNAGVAVQANPGEDGFARLAPGALESSNVELAAEFANLIVAQRAYQASVRAYSIGDQMLAIAADITS